VCVCVCVCVCAAMHLFLAQAFRRMLPATSHGIRSLLLRPLSLLLEHNTTRHQQELRSKQQKRKAKGSEFQDLALIAACADGTLQFDR
jgi:hypothetical protein